ncbi:hypothetical protein L3Q82_005233 [Scortum barcoo]|uniref:Uncharacterized protein n=1 Tax=Scortum barcoo TaxID=214431 RepID=A0ACB8V9X0_9TELE|nr:hypothetical protein L3Q82_005233 [Scortum barcoo]
MQLDQTRERTEELKTRIAAVQQDKVTLQQNMALEREAFTVKKESLSRKVDQAEAGIKQQRQEVSRGRRELDEVNNMKREAYDRLDEQTVHMAKLESSIRSVKAFRVQYEKQLEAESQKRRELRQQRETLKRELCELVETFRDAVQRLKEGIAAVEGKIEEGRASRLLSQDSLAQIYELFMRQHNEEKEAKAEHFRVSQQLERSKLQLEERIASIVRHSKEIKEMGKQIQELLEADTINTINRRVFERNQEEMCGNVHTEKKNISPFGGGEEAAEGAPRGGEEEAGGACGEAKMSSDISRIREHPRRHLEEIPGAPKREAEIAHRPTASAQ